MPGPTSGPRRRVLWLIMGLGRGGAERLLVSAATAHDRLTHELHVAYVLPWKSALVPELEALGVEVHCLGARAVHDPRWPIRLRRLLADGHFDVVHAHSPLLAATTRLVAPTLRRNGPVRSVVTEHNVWPSYSRATRLLHVSTARGHSAHLAVSDEVRSSMPARLRQRVEVVVHGVVLHEIPRGPGHRAAIRRELNVGAGEILVVTVANFRPHKGYATFFAAARQVVDRCDHVRFVAVGQGPLEDEVRALHRSSGLGDRVQVLVHRDDVPLLLAAADLFVLASDYEGYPVAVMEALATGLPVIATAVGGVAHAVRDGREGRTVAPSRPELLAAAIVELASDPERRSQMARAAAERGRAYDITRTVRRVEAIYSELTA